jgi:NAD(P)-dependent dehydrogenase (short-subunit alcohol dehydrogenase family)
MKIEGAVALVTGANRGLGASFAQALLEAGAAKVYAGARDPKTVTDPRLTPLRLDITKPADIAAALEAAGDVAIVINNAGIANLGSFTGVPDLDNAHAEMETNYFGTLAVSRAFAPVLAANGGGALVNMLSAASFRISPLIASYSASKTAQWALTNALRLELKPQGTLVVGVHAGFIDTDLAAGFNTPKIAPADVAEQTMAAILADHEEVLADEVSRQAKGALSGDLHLLYPELA